MLDAAFPVGVSGEELDIPSDGAVLCGRLVRPRGTPRAALVLHGATGAPARFYRGFAEWAARERDLAVLTYDYRDFGASLAATDARVKGDAGRLGAAGPGGGPGGAGADLSRD